MIWAIFGTLLGMIIGITFKYSIPLEFIKYTAVVIIGILDALFGAMKSEATHDEQYNATIFITGLVFNTILALAITFLGERLGLDLYLAVTVVFTFRIFSNLGVLRRAVLDLIAKHKK